MPAPDPDNPLLLSLARAGGGALASVIRGVAALRSSGKPLHPRGTVVRGRLVRHGLDDPTGVAWLDEPGQDDVLIRWSRAVGLPAPLPDIHGLAVRIGLTGNDVGDLLLATTGWSRLTRVLLVPGFSAQRPMTTLLPYATPRGPVLLGAVPGPDSTKLYVASLLGEWREFAVLEETAGDRADESTRFDPVVHPLPDLAFPAWVRRLREPAYSTARKAMHPAVTVTTASSGDGKDLR